MDTKLRNEFFQLVVGARRSPLSQAQLREVELALFKYHPHIAFNGLLVDTSGDKDLVTSLRGLDKTDFFTKEIDLLLLSAACRIAIHSAKDLPFSIPKGIKIVALTAGVDPADSLVLRPGASFANLPLGAMIATSSERREAAVRELRSDLCFCDIRGTIGQRLEKLDQGVVDGVVIAEAALIRLGLRHLNRVKVPGETVKYQGQLAILARDEDHEMFDLFACLDSRNNREEL
ncbi:MAG: hydroxymethylbilane synthase [Parachlamydiaceae bacterium]|nr:hydroxymethylbilane synthase [Parachlamydiaceae bacterium]